ncbi:hypothetical protein DFH06DRAFT_1326445 [Mycena polygramma]|nr:hypothetical protein DFH06DRAFT_1326445 [Mycena polygramma]
MSLTLGGTHPVSFQGGTFNNIAGNQNNIAGDLNIVSQAGDNGLYLLYRRVLEDAMHNSVDRPPDPACHPGTRESVLDTLWDWSWDDSPHARLMWLYGSAGMGKSAITQTFAAECQEDGILGASFFFRRGDTRRGNWKSLFSTLAYQLAASHPEFGNALRQAIEADKLVFGQAMRHQFQKFIVAPFEETPPLAAPPIIVIDGLDECEDHGAQIMLLKLLIEGLRTGAFPVRVLLASRPEAHLREVLQASENYDVCRHLELRADTSAYNDIRRYFCDEFSRVRNCLVGRGVPLENGWPGKDAINHLVEKSSGTFIYATTVVRYVDDEYSHPAERLKSVLALDPDSTAPLDTLYTQILSNVPNRSVLRRVLHAVLGKRRYDWDPEVIDAGLNLPAGTSRLALRGLHSILSVPPIRPLGSNKLHEVTLLHASLGDFLRDPMRSLDFFVDTLELDCALVRTMIEFLSSSPTNQYLFETITVDLMIRCTLNKLPDSLPTDDLLPVLRDVDFQHVAYMSSHVIDIDDVVDWLKKFHPLQSNLIQIWEDLYLVSELDRRADDGSSNTTHDSSYAQVLAGTPQVLSILHVVSVWTHAVSVWPHDPADYPWRRVLNFLNLKWNALRPLTALRTLQGGVQPGNSLIKFIRDPRRAVGNLYADSQDIYQSGVLRYISRIRQIFTNHEEKIYQLSKLVGVHWEWLEILLLCLPSDRVLHELEDLDLAQSCAHLQMNKDFHMKFHQDVLRKNEHIRFPSPPLRTIEFWERQLAMAEACWQSLRLEIDDSD